MAYAALRRSALGQVGLIMLEVHAVTQQGKDSGSLGIWSDEHISPLQKVVQAIHDQGSKAGLQLWHVGRSWLNPFWPRQAAEQLGVRIEGSAFWF
ncbi:transposase [Paenibacillus sp. AK121]|uniref:oxidoreductase n=1 Tax=Paenibacillus sp. AK121 TaxID=2849670 RepID=UPI0020B3F82D|nr:transposase [Paenibacillus sp. AK121]